MLKAGQLVPADAAIDVADRPRYASRAGEKLAAALDAFEVAVADRACLDAGASTGGFTDVLVQRGARRVYAVDVGRGQLVERLRRDPRVESMEGVNLRELAQLPEQVDLATLDVSFISLRLVLPAVRRLLTDTGRVVALVKPQFEAGRADVPRGGVVRDPEVHRAVLVRLEADALDAGLTPAGLIRSPVIGHEGNVEFLADLRSESPPVPELRPWTALVDDAMRDRLEDHAQAGNQKPDDENDSDDDADEQRP